MDREISDKLVKWIYNKVRGAGAEGCVIGLSGGVDSTVVAALCKKAFPENTLGIHIDCHNISRDTEDAMLAAEHLGIPLNVINLEHSFDALMKDISDREHGDSEAERLIVNNVKTRLRMTVLYYYAQLNRYLVVGTANKSELSVGYFTKYGDGGVDILPIGNIVKTQVWELAKSLGIPPRIINKEPTAGFWPGQTDEKEMGFTYAQLDNVLLTGEGDIRIRAMVDKRRIINEHKMKTPPIPRIKIE